MKLVHPYIRYQFDFAENSRPIVWRIENPSSFAKQLQELQEQKRGSSGQYVLSLKGEILKISSSLDLIHSPLDLSHDQRKMLSHIAKLFEKRVLSPEFFDRSLYLLDQLREYSMDVHHALELPYVLDDRLDMIKVWKALGPHLDLFSDSLVGKVCDLFALRRQVLGDEMLVLIQWRNFFSAEDFHSLCAFFCYEKIPVIFVEGSCLGEKTQMARLYVQDQDDCEIW